MDLEQLKQAVKAHPYPHFIKKEIKWFLGAPSQAATYLHRPYPIEEWIDSPFGGNFQDILRPKVREMLVDIFKTPGKYQEVILDAGIGIGKSFLSARGVTYLLHRLLCLKNPHGFYGLARGSPIAIMNMSVNATNAKKVVFGEIMGAVETSPWFNICGYLPDPRTRSELRFPKGIQVIPGNSQELFFVGFDLFAGILDEAAWHKVVGNKDFAEEGYNQMINRVRSRFPNDGMMFIISSPRYVDDFIERKMKEAETNPKIYARRVPAWESPPPSLVISGKTFRFDTEEKKILENASMELE